MNQMGFVEISIIRDEKLFRASVPMGIAWSEARDALLEMAEQIARHIDEVEAKMKEDAEKEKE